MNLADIGVRKVVQGDRLGGRSSILPERRNTNAPELRSFGTMRDARRGDVGGAEALTRALGMVQRTGGELVDYATRKHADTERDNIAEGAADQAAGTVDPAMVEQSLGYRNAVTKGRTVTEFNKATQGFDQELRGVIEQQDSPDLDARRVEVEQRVETFFRDFAVDPETGELKGFLQSPGAMRYLAGSIQATRAETMSNALARIGERFNEEALGHFSTHIVDQIDETGLPDLSEARTLLPGTVSDEQVAEYAITAMENGAFFLLSKQRFGEATALLSAMRGYKGVYVETDGEGEGSGPDDPVTLFEKTGTVAVIPGLSELDLSAKQQARLNQLYRTATQDIRGMWRQKVEEEQSSNATSLMLGLFGQGGFTTRLDITDAHERGEIDDGQVIALLRTQESRQEARRIDADRAVARMDRAEARREREENRRLGRVADAAVASITSDVTRGASPATARSAALQIVPNLDPRIQGEVLSRVNTLANSVESAIANSDVVRGHSREFTRMTDNAPAMVNGWNVPPSRRSRVAKAVEIAVGIGETEYLERVIAGEDPAKVKAEIAKDIASQLSIIQAENSIRP